MEHSYRFIGQEKYRIIGPWPEPKVIEDQPAAYWKSSAIRPGSFNTTGLEESLERIVSNEEPEMERGLADRVISDKSRTLKATLKALFHQILTREKLNYELMKQIDSDMCKTGTYLEGIRMLTVRDYTRQFADLDRRRTQLEGRVMELSREKRQESVAVFKDLAYASKGILSALRSYWNLNATNLFLNDKNTGRDGKSLPQTQTYHWQ